MLKNLVLFAGLSLSLLTTTVQARVCEFGKSCDPWGYDTDGGENVTVPGCILETDVPKCGDPNMVVMISDFCIDSNAIHEQVSEPVCTHNHIPSSRPIGCNDYCRYHHNQPGRCATTTVAECGEANVGYCICGDR